MNEAGEKFGIIAVALRLADEADDGVLCVTGVRLEVGVELVGNRQARTQRKRTTKGFLGQPFAVAGGVDVFSDDAMASPELRPRGSKAWIEIETAQIQVSRLNEAIVGAHQLVSAQIQLVRARVRPRCWRDRRRCPSQWKRQRIRDTLGDVVLDLEQVAKRRLDGVRREQRAAGRFDELCGGA